MRLPVPISSLCASRHRFPSTRKELKPPQCPVTPSAFLPSLRAGWETQQQPRPIGRRQLWSHQPIRVFSASPSHPRTGQQAQGRASGSGWERVGHQPPCGPPAEQGRQGVLHIIENAFSVIAYALLERALNACSTVSLACISVAM